MKSLFDLIATSYHDNQQYADLSIYGLPHHIVTNTNKKIYDCTMWFIKNKRFGRLDQMLASGKCIPVHDKTITVHAHPDLGAYTSLVYTNVIYNNFFLAPWSPNINKNSNTPTLFYYRLNTYKPFAHFPDIYYGTNHGTVWNIVHGVYTSRSTNKEKTYIYYVLRNKEQETEQVKAQDISSYYLDHTKHNLDNSEVVHIGDITDNYVDNLMWSSRKNDITENTNRKEFLDKETVDTIISQIANDPNTKRSEIYDKWAEELNVSIKYIIQSFNAYYDKNDLKALLNPSLQNKIEYSNTPLIVNDCSFVKDYNPTYEYAVLYSFGLPDMVVTKDNVVYRIHENMVDLYFPKDKSKWISYENLKRSYDVKRIISSIHFVNCNYLDTKSLSTKLVYENYFGNSPWYLRICGNNINYAYGRSHSSFKNILKSYFICDNGLTYNVKTGKYSDIVPDGSYLSTNVGLSFIDSNDPNRTGSKQSERIFRTSRVLIGSYGFGEPTDEELHKRIALIYPNK